MATDAEASDEKEVSVQTTPVYFSVLRSAFGEPLDVGDLDDDVVLSQLDTIRSEGYRCIRVAAGSTIDLALAATPEGLAAEIPFDSVIVCTDATDGQAPGAWSTSYQVAAALSSTPVILVSGAECANVIPGLDVARGLIATGKANNVLLMLVDRLESGSRYTSLSRSVYSDAAVSCLVSREPRSGSFLVLGTAGEPRSRPVGERNELAEARATLLAMGRAAKRAGGERRPEDFVHLVTPNLGASTRRLLAMATHVPLERVFEGSVAEFGHCFTADIPINLRALAHSGLLKRGTPVLALASSQVLLGAVALAWVPLADDA